MNAPPAVSIVMPCYNGARHLPTSIGSIQAQTFDRWELLVVDDGSTDDSLGVLRRLAAQDGRIRVEAQANTGAGAARNRGLRNAQAELVAFLDADDTWHPTFLEKMVAALETTPDAGIAYCGWQNLGVAGGRGDPFVPPDYERPDKPELMLGGCRWPIHGVLIRRNILLQAGGFDESLSSCMDYDLWLRTAPFHRLTRVAEVLAYYHHHEGEQITKNRARVALNHWRSQRAFLHDHPDTAANISRERLRELVHGELLRRGYECYWQRDLTASRRIFRTVMRHGYGGARDWLYMLPSLLPESLHQRLLTMRDRSTA